MHYYIDGYNLLFKVSFQHKNLSLEEKRTRLIELLEQYASTYNLSLSLVFDGQDENSTQHFHSIEIVYTGSYQSADDYLIDLFSSLTHKKRAVLVTSDNKLRYTVQHMGFKSMSIEDFLHIAKKRRRKRTPKSASYQSTKKEEEHLPPLSDFSSWEKIFSDLMN